MSNIIRHCVLATLLLVAANRAAEADTLNFNYTLSDGNVLGGSLTGTLQADGNTFDVSGSNSITYDGAPLTISPDFFEAYSNFSNGVQAVDGSGVLTLDGSYGNFIDYNGATGIGFDIIVNAGFPYSNGVDIGTFGFSTLGDQPFIISDFVATVTTDATDVPEPATAALLCASFAGLVRLRRRRG